MMQFPMADEGYSWIILMRYRHQSHMTLFGRMCSCAPTTHRPLGEPSERESNAARVRSFAPINICSAEAIHRIITGRCPIADLTPVQRLRSAPMPDRQRPRMSDRNEATPMLVPKHCTRAITLLPSTTVGHQQATREPLLFFRNPMGSSYDSAPSLQTMHTHESNAELREFVPHPMHGLARLVQSTNSGLVTPVSCPRWTRHGQTVQSTFVD